MNEYVIETSIRTLNVTKHSVVNEGEKEVVKVEYVQSGHVYAPGDVYYVSFNKPSTNNNNNNNNNNDNGNNNNNNDKKKDPFRDAESVFEVGGEISGKFIDGGCDGHRSTDKLAQLVIDNEATEDISIIGAWARGHEQVKLTPVFWLLPKAKTEEEVKSQEDL